MLLIWRDNLIERCIRGMFNICSKVIGRRANLRISPGLVQVSKVRMVYNPSYRRDVQLRKGGFWGCLWGQIFLSLGIILW